MSEREINSVSNILNQIGESDSSLKNAIEVMPEKQIQEAVKSGILEYLNARIQTSGNRSILGIKVSEELMRRLDLPFGDEDRLTNDQLLMLHNSEIVREGNEMKNLISLVKQQFINIKIQGQPNSDSPQVKDIIGNEKLKASDVNNIRNVLQFIESKRREKENE